MSSTTQTIAFFGATGGCAAAALGASLRDGHTCVALARTPEKLRNLLTTQHSIPASTLDAHLTIRAGNIKNVDDVRPALVSPHNTSQLVDKIIFGIGGTPKPQVSLTKPLTIDDPTICETGVRTIFSALESLEQQTPTPSTKPLLVVISSTGIQSSFFKKPDLPFLMKGMYHWLLAVPAADKREMEELVANDKKSHIRDFVIVRASALVDGKGKGLDKVRAGWEWPGNQEHKEPEQGPAIGYTIARNDVGEWIHRNVVLKNGFEGKRVTLTY